MPKQKKRLDTVTIAGHQLKEWRKKRTLTQEELASGLCHHGYISTIESRPRARISRDLAQALADRLDVTLDTLEAQPTSVPATTGRRAALGRSPALSTGTLKSPLATSEREILTRRLEAADRHLQAAHEELQEVRVLLEELFTEEK